MNYAVCSVPVSPLRKEPFHESEMTTQQLFGETCVIIEREKDHWIKLRCDYDQYEGWCKESHIIETGQKITEVRQLSADWSNKISFNGQPMMIPYGSNISALMNGEKKWGNTTINFHGNAWDCKEVKKDEAVIRQVGLTFLNSAYIWGGKSVFGIDCSGFAQSVYKFLGVPILRDAKQQAFQGEMIGFLEEAKCGDLAFFDDEDGQIVHVGILLNSHEILHASGKVRIDKIDNLGIVNSENFERTHKLRVIKRFF